MKKVTLAGLFITLQTIGQAYAQDKSALYYDPISGQFITQDQLSSGIEQELFFAVQLGQIDLGEIMLYERDNQLWVTLENLVDFLEFPINTTYSLDEAASQVTFLQADGWYIAENNRFSLRLQGNQVLVNANTDLVMDQAALFVMDKKVYYPFNTALAWFGIDANINQSQLKINLNSRQKLPVEQRLARKSQFSGHYLNQFELQHPRYDVPYRAISPVFADVQLTGSRYLDRDRYSATILGSGDLAYMTGRYYINHQQNEPGVKDVTNMRLTLLRDDIDSSLLGPLKASHVSLGDISPTSIANLSSGGNDLGVRVSNRPYGRITNANSTNIMGQQQPGWEVELYQNGILVPTMQADDSGETTYVTSKVVGANGRYEFLDVPLSVGENIFTLKFYGPQGQREELVETYNLDQSSLVGGKLIYDLSVSQQDTQIDYYFKDEIEPDPKKQRFNLHLEKGIGRNLSLTTDYSRYYFNNGMAHDFVQPGVRIFAFDTLLNANYTQDLAAGSQYNVALSKGFGAQKSHKLSYQFRSREQDFRVDSTDTTSNKTNQNARLQGPIIKSGWTRLNYLVSATESVDYNDRSVVTYDANLGLALGRLALTNNYSHSIVKTGSTETVRSYGGFQLNSNWRKLNYRAGLTYLIEPEEKLQASSFSLLWNMANAFSSEYQYNKNHITNNEVHKIGMFWTHRRFISSFNVSQLSQNNYSGNINFRFSLGHDPLKNKLVMSSRSMSNYGAAAVFVYHDLNNNQVFDYGEPAVEGVQVRSPQFRSRDYTDKHGRAFIPNLYPTEPTDIEIDPKTLTDPYWVPSVGGQSFLPRPGLVKTIYIPLSNAGEVEGKVTVIKNIESNPVGQGRVPLTLTRVSDQKSYQEYTSFDGLFLFNKVLPGEYWLTIDADYLKRHKLQAPSPSKVIIRPEGSVILGANFTLYPQDMVKLQAEPNYKNEVFWINLGEFSSERNAKIVAQSMRQIFPAILSNAPNHKPYELNLAQIDQSKYLLKLGPLDHINNAKIICGALLKENLSCAVEKVIVSEGKNL